MYLFPEGWYIIIIAQPTAQGSPQRFSLNQNSNCRKKGETKSYRRMLLVMVMMMVMIMKILRVNDISQAPYLIYRQQWYRTTSQYTPGTVSSLEWSPATQHPPHPSNFLHTVKNQPMTLYRLHITQQDIHTLGTSCMHAESVHKRPRQAKLICAWDKWPACFEQR